MNVEAREGTWQEDGMHELNLGPTIGRGGRLIPVGQDAALAWFIFDMMAKIESCSSPISNFILAWTFSQSGSAS